MISLTKGMTKVQMYHVSYMIIAACIILTMLSFLVVDNEAASVQSEADQLAGPSSDNEVEKLGCKLLYTHANSLTPILH